MFVSLDEQKKRLAERLERPDKYWKYNPGDIDERLLWPKYQEAYQAMLDRTSTEYAPWHVMPCDRKWYSRLAITELLIEALEGLNSSWPPADFDVEAEKKRLAEAVRAPRCSVREEALAGLLAELARLDHPQQQRRRRVQRLLELRRTSIPRSSCMVSRPMRSDSRSGPIGCDSPATMAVSTSSTVAKPASTIRIAARR